MTLQVEGETERGRAVLARHNPVSRTRPGSKLNQNVGKNRESNKDGDMEKL